MNTVQDFLMCSTVESRLLVDLHIPFAIFPICITSTEKLVLPIADCIL